MRLKIKIHEPKYVERTMKYKEMYTYEKTGCIIQKTTEADREAALQQVTMLG